MDVVIWYDKWSPLLLARAKQDEEGNFTEGWVVNGQWKYRLDLEKGKCCAYEGTKLMNSWDAPKHIPFVVVPKGVRGDYNQVIEWAEKQKERLDSPLESRVQ